MPNFQKYNTIFPFQKNPRKSCIFQASNCISPLKTVREKVEMRYAKHF